MVGTPVAINKKNLSALAKQLRDCKVTLSRNNVVMDRGQGSNALDHPALAMAFLADILAKQPAFDALSAGEIITTGTLTTALPIKPGVQGIELRLTA